MSKSYSPLRYPGGKSKLTAYVLETLKLNNLIGGVYVEPFAGGAAISWYLLLEGHVEEVYINDLNPSVYAFWHSVINDTENLCSMIDETPVTIEQWRQQKAVQTSRYASLLKLGFSTFFLNRTNRSGILNAGAIGGMNQNGNYKIDCRFNKKDLINRIQKIGNKRSQICLTNLDGAEFISDVLPSVQLNSLINIDPPYYVKGKGLYQNFFEHEDHCRLFDSVKNIKQPWMVTYDDTPEINEIYHEFNPTPFGLSYTAQEKRKGTEVIIHNPLLQLCGHKPGISFSELKKLKSKSDVNIA